MRYGAMVVLLGVLGVGTALGQSQDSETLQAILTEMRGMHNDVRLSQTTQILLAELVLQQAQVNRAMQKRDDAKAKVSQLQDNEKNMTAQLTQFADRATTTTDPQQLKQLAQVQDNFKTQLANLKSQEQDRGNDLLDADNALRKEQDTLAGIQDQLNAVVKKLQPADK